MYVLNTGGSSGVAGFKLSEHGKLDPIPNSVRLLSTNTSGAASLSFSPDGRFLAVTERLTNEIDVFSVHEDGTLSPVAVNQDALPGTFAVTFALNGAALVVETGAAGAQNGSTISSYGILDDGSAARLLVSDSGGHLLVGRQAEIAERIAAFVAEVLGGSAGGSLSELANR